jgi:pyridoxal phosphate enzyme (YggS family)
MSRLIDNLNHVRERIAGAARRSGRSADSVSLVAVTKCVPEQVIEALIEAGCVDLGESRPQALRAKAAALASRYREREHPPAIRWHQIGHLQRNKVESILPLVALIHSADSVRLLQAIDQAAGKNQTQVNVLIEVNVSGDATKHGFAAADLKPALPAIAGLANVSVRGLMCMAARDGDEAVARENFAALRQLRDRLIGEAPENTSLDELSMGMSSDYEIAIEEGATMVRVGSALFEGLEF